MMSKVVSTQLQDGTFQRLNRMAHALGKTPSDTIATLVEEGLRESEFALIEFHSSPLGRQAFMKGSSLAVWEVIKVAQHYELNVALVSEHFERSQDWVQAAINYAEAFSREIKTAIEASKSTAKEDLTRLLPNLEIFSASQEEA